MSSILILHGFTGNPRDARELAIYLRTKLGAEVDVPRLPGHGTKPEDLFHVTFRDWYETALAAYDRLAQQGPVAVIGISFGANLMFRLATERQPVALVALGAPYRMSRQFPIRVGVKFMKLWTSTYIKRGPHKNEHIPGYRQTAYDRIPLVALEQFMRFLETYMRPQTLHSVEAPALLVQSTIDPVVAPHSLDRFMRHLGSKEKRVLIWNHHRHLLVQGGRKDELFTEVASFIKPYLTGKETSR